MASRLILNIRKKIIDGKERVVKFGAGCPGKSPGLSHHPWGYFKDY